MFMNMSRSRYSQCLGANQGRLPGARLNAHSPGPLRSRAPNERVWIFQKLLQCRLREAAIAGDKVPDIGVSVRNALGNLFRGKVVSLGYAKPDHVILVI